MGKFKIEMGDITTYVQECTVKFITGCDSPGSRTGIAGGMQDVRRM